MSHISVPLFLCVISAITTNALAQTYYLDSAEGNDTYSGTQPISSGVDGPWMTMSKVNSTSFQPGDQILFKCGQNWKKALEPLVSGTSTQPIRFGSYPSGCSNKPTISGFTKLNAYNWSLENDGAWRAILPANIIRNGSLTTSYADWRIWSNDQSARLQTPSSCVGTTQRCLAIINKAYASLTSSSPFEVDGATRYRLRFSARLEPNQTMKAILRQDASPWTTLGLISAPIVGTGAWKTQEFRFTTNRGAPQARLDFQIPANQIVYVRDVELINEDQLDLPFMVSQENIPLEIAHHPNRGHDTAKPHSVYLGTTAASSAVMGTDGRPHSSYIDVNPSLQLPPGGSLMPGLGVHIRNNMWAISSHKIASISSDGSRITLDTLTRYPLNFAGLGYYFTGARWMVDSDGEWNFDPNNKLLVARTRDGQSPGDRIAYATLPYGINLKARSFITIENIGVEGVVNGILMSNTEGIVLNSIRLSRINEIGIGALAAKKARMDKLDISHVGEGAILGWDSDDVSVTNSQFDQIGVLKLNDRIVGLPTHTITAITLANNSIVKGNLIKNVSYGGINVRRTSLIEDNSVSDFCLELNDCGGIILDSSAVGTRVVGNLLQRGLGNVDGLPSLFYSHSVGLYADNGANQIEFSGNAVTGTDFGMLVHDSYDLTIANNTFHGNRRYQLWVQETSSSLRADGNIVNVKVDTNKFFPTLKSAVVRHGTTQNNDPSDMSVFAGNQYANLFTDKVVLEYIPASSNHYGLNAWQQLTMSGVPRNLDVGGEVSAPLAGYAKGLFDPSIFPNPSFSNNAQGWAKWNSGGGTPTFNAEACTGLAGTCIKLSSAGSPSNFSSPYFTINKGRFYKYTFDARASSSNVTLETMLRRAGNTSYASLQGDTKKLLIGTTWQRYTLTFLATDNAIPNTAISDNGARLDFLTIPAGQTVWLANIEISPVDTNGLVKDSSVFIGNDSASTRSFDCPETGSSLSSLCSKYLEFPVGNQVIWPITLLPRESKVVFTQDISHPDLDRDGVANSQDICADTPQGTVVNAKGCGLGQ